MIEVREETAADLPAIRQVNEAAFGQPAEANLVETLRVGCKPFISLVALRSGLVVGHVLLTPVTLRSSQGELHGMGLAPMGVLPEFQNQGIGSRLVRGGLARLRETECPFVVVLGHPDYYPRFGFERASLYGIRCQWEGVPNEAFMVLVFDRAAMPPDGGVAGYRDEFSDAV